MGIDNMMSIRIDTLLPLRPLGCILLVLVSYVGAVDRPHKEVQTIDVTAQYFLKHTSSLGKVVPRYANLPHEASSGAPLRTHLRAQMENAQQDALSTSGGVVVAPIPPSYDDARNDAAAASNGARSMAHHGHGAGSSTSAHDYGRAGIRTPPGVPHTIQTLPHYDGDEYGVQYTAHLKKVFQESNKEFANEKKNLEHEVEHLQHVVHQLKKKKPTQVDVDEDDEGGEGEENYDDEHMSKIPHREGDQVGKVVSHLILGGIIFATIFFFMSQYSAGTRAMTMQIIDLVTAIFLAVAWFQGFDDLLHLHQFEEHHQVLSGACHALVLFFIVCVVSWSLRKTGDSAMPVFSACGAHYVSFSVLHFAGKTQEAFFDSNEIMCFLSVLLMLFIFLGLALVFQQCRENMGAKSKEWVEVVEDVENDLASMGIAFAFTMAVRYLVCGRYPPLEEGEGKELHHSASQRTVFLVYTICVSILAMWIIPWIDRESSRSTYHAPRIDPETNERRWRWVTLRLLKLAATTLGMLAAWSIFLWADWQFFEVFYHGEKIYGRLVFASWATIISLAVFFAVDAFGKSILGMSRKLFLTVFALVIAFAWEEVLDQALETAVEGRTHPVGVKMGAAVVIALVVFPVYVWYLKPAVDRAVKQI